ncbi:MFS transporter [Rhodospirillaceae bacterium KN72]|uniref:Lysosomal dipeptide transporter MFSD1 n=1 Tax=Pacificispira spongiicola TaxID=2729598 RepID=A0A7Y0HE74_9PROT|nr:MFS transporter [Pacificispira spongiicola]NMM44556.1 MFS transporter [Pacificispira spongiicola]
MTTDAADPTPAAVSKPSLRAWAAFGLGCCCFGYAFLQRVAPSVMTDDLMRDFSVGAGALGALSAFYFYAYAGMQMPIGILIDRYGPRRILSAAMAACLVGSLVFAFADNLGIASAGRAMIGAAVAFGYVGSMAIAGTWFPTRHFSLLIGILQSIGMAGAMTGQAPMSLAVSALGWRDTITAMGIGAAVLAVLVFLVVQELPPHRKQAASAAKKGAFSDVLRNPQSWVCAILGFTLTPPMLAFAGLWSVPWLVDVYGMTKPDAATTASLIFLGWAAVGPVIGWATERIGRRKPILYLGFLLGAGAMACLFYIPNLPIWAIRVLFLINGIGGCTMILCFTCVRELNRPSRAGSGLGFVNMFVVGAGAVFQPLIGVLLDLNWDGALVDGAPVYTAGAYSVALSAMLVAQAIGFIACLLLKETRCRQL